MNRPIPISPLASPASLLAKPAGPRCNLRCTYCFYIEKENLARAGQPLRMPDVVLDRYIRSYLASQPTREVVFGWQGGEPTLAGLAFFRRAVALQKRYGAGRVISNALQTNGILLDDDWCAFLAEEHFLVGLSVDGPEDIHNRYRVYADGHGSFEEVMAAAERLRRHGVDVNVLASVTRESAREGRRVYTFLKNAGFRFMQFIPIVERRPTPADRQAGLELGAPPSSADAARDDVMPFSVDPPGYGRFLADIFDVWVRRDVGSVFVNHFDAALAALMEAPAPLCVYSPVCGTAPIVELDGGVYSCDHYVYPDYRLGNLMHDDLAALIACRRQRAFGLQKAEGLTDDCRKCRYLEMCRGGCPKHRFSVSPGGQAGHPYLCGGMMSFYDHVMPDIRRMADLLRKGRPPADIMRRRKGRR